MSILEQRNVQSLEQRMGNFISDSVDSVIVLCFTSFCFYLVDNVSTGAGAGLVIRGAGGSSFLSILGGFGGGGGGGAGGSFRYSPVLRRTSSTGNL